MSIIAFETQKKVHYPFEKVAEKVRPHFAESMEVVAAHSDKILILAWHDYYLPCADFCCPEGQRPQTHSVDEKPFLNPFLAKYLRLCNDIETNPGPSPNKRRSNSKGRQGNRPLQRYSIYSLLLSTFLYVLRNVFVDLRYSLL